MTADEMFEFLNACTPSEGYGRFVVTTLRRSLNEAIEISVKCEVCNKKSSDPVVTENLR